MCLPIKHVLNSLRVVLLEVLGVEKTDTTCAEYSKDELLNLQGEMT